LQRTQQGGTKDVGYAKNRFDRRGGNGNGRARKRIGNG
jgi:hypothetical protein